jgi:MerR family transcriptional regulator, light-induced transcriptional regulator
MSNNEQVYSIKDLERISGIKAHTIRIWEQRYNLFVPERTDTNIRIYRDEDLKKLLNTSVLLKAGLKISKISKLSEEETKSLIFEKQKTDNQVINGFVNAMIDFNSIAFNDIINDAILYAGFEQTLDKFIYPLFEKIGILWQTNSISPAHEHFVSNILRQKLFSEIEKLPNPTQTAKKIILFLHENEQHELGLLYAYYVLKQQGYNVHYLGQNLPLKDLFISYNKIKPEYLLTFFVSNIDELEIKQLIMSIINHVNELKLIVSGKNATQIAKNNFKGVIYVDKPQSLKNIDFLFNS